MIQFLALSFLTKLFMGQRHAVRNRGDRPSVEVAAAERVTIVDAIATAVKDAEVVFSCVGDVPDVEVRSTGAAGSWALSNLGPKMIEADYAPGFAIKHIVKDLRLVLATDRTSGDNLPGTKLAERLFKAVQQMDDRQGREQGTQAMMRAYQSTIEKTTNAN